MKRIISLACFVFSISSFLSGQDWCPDIKPADFEKTPFLSQKKIVTDRFFHTINPAIVIFNKLQLESAIVYRNEFLSSQYFEHQKTSNVYSFLKFRYSFINNFEVNLSINDLIVYTGNEIIEYGGPSPYTRLSLGAKYLLFTSKRAKQKFGFYGQIAFPQKQMGLKISQEFKFLYSILLIRNLECIINIGETFINDENGFFVYSLEFDWHITKKFKMITEFYKNYSHLTVLHNVNNYFLIGYGKYFQEDLFGYVTYEKDFFNPQYLDMGRIDVGISYRF